MKNRKLFLGVKRSLCLMGVAVMLLGNRPASPQEKVLHSFQGGSQDGNNPSGMLTLDAAGNLYGRTELGGNGGCPETNYSGCGTIFELSPQSGGGWTETILYNFQQNGLDGIYPNGGLVFDTAGNLYGTTQGGGTGTGCSDGGVIGCGTVFELSPQAGGGWAETVLHSFQDQLSDGTFPQSGLIIDAAGNLYGTSSSGGRHYDGTIFELSPQSGGGWVETVLHNFAGTDGSEPNGLIADATGNFYSTTEYGGDELCSSPIGPGCGTVFELMPQSGGHWSGEVLHRFQNNGKDGINPVGNLTFDRAGNLFGATYYGGVEESGTVFQLRPISGGHWVEKVLFNFPESATPTSGLVLNRAGNLIGTANGGETAAGFLYQVSHVNGDIYAESVLYAFPAGGQDGDYPVGGVIFDAVGNIYGTTIFGGGGACSLGCGIVFEIIR